MASVIPLLNDIIAKARTAEALVADPNAKQTLVEIRLAAACLAQAERKAEAAPAVPITVLPHRHD